MLQARLHQLQVVEDQFEFQRRGVAHRVDVALGVNHGVVPESTDYMYDGVAIPEAVENLSLLLVAGDAPGEAGDIEALHIGVSGLLRLEDLRQAVDALVRHLDGAHMAIGADGVGIWRRFQLLTGECVENGGLAGVRQPDDAQLHVPSLPRIG